ncbi:MAG: hypothetical protein EP343_12015 [Deltaproteobacteria bacterium]|nr:MAG: hypothetical protein EP343_12015 [Deltaproteobacteria bacterium]
MDFRRISGWTSLVLCLLGLGTTGCVQTHVKIELPPPGSSLEHRSNAYQVYRRKGLGFRVFVERLCVRFRGEDGRRLERPRRYITQELRCPHGREIGFRKVREAYPNALLLGSGQKVYYLNDLLPAVFPRSRTAEAIRKSENNANSARLAFGVGMPASLVVGGILAGLSFGIRAADPYNTDLTVGMLISGASITVLGILASSIAGGILSARSRELRWNAYDTYNADLVERLGLNPGTTPPTSTTPAPPNLSNP